MKKQVLIALLIICLSNLCFSQKPVKKRVSPRDYTEKLHYPPPILNYNEINRGGFILYLLGIFYLFLGVKQVHKNYLVPCLKLFIKTNTFDLDTMASTVRPIAVTATETFMSFFATFFGVTDVGISAFLGSNAFTACIERGVLIFFAGSYGEIDWYTSLRDMITYSIVLLAIGLLVSNSEIAITNALLMMLIFFVYWIFMHYNSKIEKYLRKAAYLKKKYKILPRLADEQIKELHSIKRREFECLPEYYIEDKYEMKKGRIELTYHDVTSNF